MHLETGQIVEMTDAKLKEALGNPYVPVDMRDATPKQQAERRVSLSDHRSILGEQLTKQRAERGMTKNSLRNLRRKGKLK